MKAAGQKVLVLGASGMLGHTLLRYLAKSEGIDVVGSIRGTNMPSTLPAERIRTGVDATDENALRNLLDAEKPDALVNCVGLVKQRHEAQSPELAITINALLPHVLARLCRETGTRLIHLSTDCVFDGASGNYREDSQATCRDLYGRSKLLGEVTDGDALTIRTSIIGPELGNGLGLLSWFLRQEGSARGFARAIFSGLPTVELSRVIRDYILPDPGLRGLYHVSAEPISKYDLLKLINEVYEKSIRLEKDETFVIDRSLDSSAFRRRTNYQPPDWPTLIRSMKAFA
jgi:dTDP-4-dehydrorhamnose reductase